MVQMGGGDMVGTWEVRLSDGVHHISFEHGTTTGKRVVTVDEQVRYFLTVTIRKPNMYMYRGVTYLQDN